MSLRVLLVDDDVATSVLVANELRKHGLRVSYAKTLHLALELIPNVKPDVVLLDLMLPDSTGKRSCVARVRAAHKAPRKLLLVTGLSGHEIIELAATYGAELVVKPYDVDELAKKLLAGLPPAEE